MEKKFIILTVLFFFVLRTNAQTKKNGTPAMRYKSNKGNYSNTYFTQSPQPTQTIPLPTTTKRPFYDGQTHTESHGGSYPGSINSHHKDGHYLSPKYNNVYGIHKTKKN